MSEDTVIGCNVEDKPFIGTREDTQSSVRVIG
jgi:hypothetical protein